VTLKDAALVARCGLAEAVSSTAAAAPVVITRPSVVQHGQPATVSVTGILAASLQMRPDGTTTAAGAPLPPRRMMRTGGSDTQPD
jgi:hypothetical protein